MCFHPSSTFVMSFKTIISKLWCFCIMVDYEGPYGANIANDNMLQELKWELHWKVNGAMTRSLVTG